MSSPYDTLTAETLQYLTVDQAIKDLTHFAMTAKLPFDPKGTSRANRAVSGILQDTSHATLTHTISLGFSLEVRTVVR